MMWPFEKLFWIFGKLVNYSKQTPNDGKHIHSELLHCHHYCHNFHHNLFLCVFYVSSKELGSVESMMITYFMPNAFCFILSLFDDDDSRGDWSGSHVNGILLTFLFFGSWKSGIFYKDLFGFLWLWNREGGSSKAQKLVLNWSGTR